MAAELDMESTEVESPDPQYLQIQSRLSRSNEKKFICNVRRSASLGP